MAILANAWPTLLDVARRKDPNGSIATIAEVLQQYNENLDDIPWMEGNMETGHKSTIRTSKPTPTWRLLNQGVIPAKSTTGQMVDTCGMLEAYAEIDKDLANLNGNTAAYRLSEDKAFIEAMSDAINETIFYGDTDVNPERFVGLSARYFALTGQTTSPQIINAGGTGSDNTSIWLVCWGEGKVFGIYPKGSRAGLQHSDLGEVTVYDSQTPIQGRYQAYRSHYQWKAGLVVSDYRHIIRIANIDVAALLTAGDAGAGDTSANLLKFMSLALDALPPGGNYRPVFYMNNTVTGLLRVKMQDKGNVYLTLDQLTGYSPINRRPTLSFHGVPIRRVDSILKTEDALT